MDMEIWQNLRTTDYTSCIVMAHLYFLVLKLASIEASVMYIMQLLALLKFLALHICDSFQYPSHATLGPPCIVLRNLHLQSILISILHYLLILL